VADEQRSEPVRRLPRAQRREQILAAATTAFARHGFTATGLDDIAAEAGITRVLLYRHFGSKTELCQAALDRFCAVLSDHVTEPVGGFTGASIDGFVQGRDRRTGRVPLLFVHAAREPEFRSAADRFHARVTEIAHRQIAPIVTDHAWARWAARTAPAVAIDAIIAWLDAGLPDPGLAADRVRHVIAGVITAAAADRGVGCLPP